MSLLRQQTRSVTQATAGSAATLADRDEYSGRKLQISLYAYTKVGIILSGSRSLPMTSYARLRAGRPVDMTDI